MNCIVSLLLFGKKYVFIILELNNGFYLKNTIHTWFCQRIVKNYLYFVMANLILFYCMSWFHPFILLLGQLSMDRVLYSTRTRIRNWKNA